MHCFKALVFGVSAFAAAVSAQNTVAFTTVPSTAQAGMVVTIGYTSSDLAAPVTIIVRKGDPMNLDTIETITTTATGGSYTWTVPASYVSGDNYALQINQGSAINYSGLFAVTGGAAAPASMTSAAMTSASMSMMQSMSTPASSMPYMSATSSMMSSMAHSSAMEHSSTSHMSAMPTSSSMMHMGTATTLVPSMSKAMNSTMIKPTLSATPSGFAGNSTGPIPSNGAAGLSSPLALIVCAVAAFAYFN